MVKLLKILKIRKNDNFIEGNNNMNGCWTFIKSNEDQNIGNVLVTKRRERKSVLIPSIKYPSNI